MTILSLLPTRSEDAHGSTQEFATLNLVRPQSVRKRLCQTGSYFGIKPTKLPNGKLLWPLRQQKG